MTVRELSLRPYPGRVLVCKTRKAYQEEHVKLFGNEDDLRGKYGRMTGGCVPGKPPTYLVWACDTARLAHELSHVILHVFELAGIDPREANGEPFCYMLSQLMLDAR